MAQENEYLENYLLKNNLRNSAQRLYILEVFLKEKGHINVEKLYKKVVNEYPSIGIATVYRALNLFHDAGIIKRNQFKLGIFTYERLGKHHDHMICEECGKIIEFENSVVEKTQELIAEQQNFKILSHRFELYGVCSYCIS